jgi:hypothetical protein
MWEATVQSAVGGRVRQYALRLDGRPVSYSEVVNRWQQDHGFRAFFSALLADAPFDAFRWETPPVTSATAARDFEFVLLDAPGLSRAPEPEAFEEHFRGPDGDRPVVAFPNLGNDAVLVVPRGDAPAPTYVHLAAFVRGAPEAQKHELWKLVGGAVQSRLSPRPLWLSTAGAGVAWLHVRLDSRPKYYGHRPYTSVTA